MSDLLVQYAAAGAAATEWDEQHVRLAAASGQVADVVTGGFPPRVALVASAFCFRWADHLDEVGREAEQRADGLRDALRLYLDSDESSLLASARLLGLLGERR